VPITTPAPPVPATTGEVPTAPPISVFGPAPPPPPIPDEQPDPEELEVHEELPHCWAAAQVGALAMQIRNASVNGLPEEEDDDEDDDEPPRQASTQAASGPPLELLELELETLEPELPDPDVHIAR
jgi:hypothetical protein